MERKEYQIGESDIFVERLIPDSKKHDNSLLFIHGIFSGYFTWGKITTYLARNGFETLALSLRGHKSSGKADLSKVRLEDYLEDIKDVVDEFGMGSPVLIGHSMGGLLSMMYVRDFGGAEALVALDPALPKGFWGSADTENTKRQLDDVVTFMDVADIVGHTGPIESLPDLSVEDSVIYHDAFGQESGKVLKEILDGVEIPPDTLGDIPFLVVGVGLDDVLPTSIPSDKVRRMAEEFNADFYLMENTTHPGLVMGNNALKTAELIEDWLLELQEIKEAQ